MALVLVNPVQPLTAGAYLRIDGIRFEPTLRPRSDGIWSVSPETPVRFHVYAYRSTASRIAGDSPITDSAHVTTLAALALLDMVPGSANLRLGPAWRAKDVDTASLWHALYRQLRLDYPSSDDDIEKRSPDNPSNQRLETAL